MRYDKLTSRGLAPLATLVAAGLIASSVTTAVATTPAPETPSPTESPTQPPPKMPKPPADGPSIDVTRHTVFVTTTVDTDNDGEKDIVKVDIERETGKTDLPVIFTHSPYIGSANPNPHHDVDLDRLPQDVADNADQPDDDTTPATAPTMRDTMALDALGELPEAVTTQDGARPPRPRPNPSLAKGYARVRGYSIGDKGSTGCPTVGDRAEAMGAVAVIDWLNGRADAVDENDKPVTADWASGDVGMIGGSYNGTLATMAAATGVDGLKAIVPMAGISNWYDYYRANGLVVGPGGWVGEDIDKLATFVARPDACEDHIAQMAKDMDRDTGDYSPFWHARNINTSARNITAATFIVHGMNDSNVRPKQATKLWEELGKTDTPRRIWWHQNGHRNPSRETFRDETYRWFDRYVKGEENGVEDEPAVEIQHPDNKEWASQDHFPLKEARPATFFPHADGSLNRIPRGADRMRFTDTGRDHTIEDLVSTPDEHDGEFLRFATKTLPEERTLSGTPRVSLDVAVHNRQAANLTIALVERPAEGDAKVITRGWADPQNSRSLSRSKPLAKDKPVTVAFNLEPVQHTFAEGSTIELVVASTDFDHTIRPAAGTELSIRPGGRTKVTLPLICPGRNVATNGDCGLD